MDCICLKLLGKIELVSSSYSSQSRSALLDCLQECSAPFIYQYLLELLIGFSCTCRATAASISECNRQLECVQECLWLCGLGRQHIDVSLGRSGMFPSRTSDKAVSFPTPLLLYAQACRYLHALCGKSCHKMSRGGHLYVQAGGQCMLSERQTVAV